MMRNRKVPCKTSNQVSFPNLPFLLGLLDIGMMVVWGDQSSLADVLLVKLNSFKVCEFQISKSGKTLLSLATPKSELEKVSFADVLK